MNKKSFTKNEDYYKRLLSSKDGRYKIFQNDLSTSIERARIFGNMTQNEMAKSLKTSQSYISRIENGSLMPSLKKMFAIAEVLNTRLLPPTFKSVHDYYYIKKTDSQNVSHAIVFAEMNIKSEPKKLVDSRGNSADINLELII